jgi:hypothetical protein
MSNAYKILVGKPERKRTLGRHRRKWGNNIRIILGEIGWESVVWMLLIEDRDRW